MSVGRWAGVVAGPACLLLGIAVLEISHQLVRIGPFDRAQIGGGVALPLILVSPGLAALAGQHSGGGRAATGVTIATAVGLGGLIAVTLLPLAAAYGCGPTADPVRGGLQAALLGVIGGAGYVLSAAVAWSRVERGVVGALAFSVAVAAASGGVLLLGFGLMFPALSCTWVPPTT